MIYRLALIFTFTLGSLAFAKSNLPKTVEEYRATARAQMAGRTIKPLPTPPLGQVLYVPVENIVASQTRFSFRRMVQKIEELLNDNGKDTLAYDHGRSAYPDFEARGGVFYRGLVYIYDRHHHTMADIYVGAETMPVLITEDWSDLSQADFDSRMIARGYKYPWGADGKIATIPPIWELPDDPYLYLPDLFMLKVKTEARDGKRTLKSAKGANPTVLLKIDEGSPFLELNAIDILHHNQFALPDLNQNLSMDTLREIAKIFNADASSTRTMDAIILSEPKRTKDLDLEKIIDDYYSKPITCRMLLRRSL